MPTTKTTRNTKRFQSLTSADSFTQKLFSRVQSLGQTSSALLRYIVLATLAFFFFSAPVSFREVTHVSHRPAPRA